MKRKWLLISLAVIVAVALVWVALAPEQRAAVTSAVGLTSAPPPAAQRKKPICSSTGIPVGDCMPQWAADLPPDPGEAGKATIAGIITNNKGVRDDVYRYIWYEYPESERAREALFLQARVKQMTVVYGDSLGKEETRKLMPEITNSAICANRLETLGMPANAAEKVRVQVTNTPERWKRSREFDYLMAHNLYDLPDPTVAEACGFDPVALPN